MQDRELLHIFEMKLVPITTMTMQIEMLKNARLAVMMRIPLRPNNKECHGYFLRRGVKVHEAGSADFTGLCLCVPIRTFACAKTMQA